VSLVEGNPDSVLSEDVTVLAGGEELVSVPVGVPGVRVLEWGGE
jgi:hypothetical protein